MVCVCIRLIKQIMFKLKMLAMFDSSRGEEKKEEQLYIFFQIKHNSVVREDRGRILFDYCYIVRGHQEDKINR